MSKRPKLTVGSLRGLPQGRAPSSPMAPVTGLGHEPLPSTAQSRRCCRRGCQGCPWAEWQRTYAKFPLKAAGEQVVE
ncbi:MAG: hypothetical protein RL885_05795 [Planctomycetota bacterium]